MSLNSRATLCVCRFAQVDECCRSRGLARVLTTCILFAEALTWTPQSFWLFVVLGEVCSQLISFQNPYKAWKCCTSSLCKTVASHLMSQWGVLKEKFTFFPVWQDNTQNMHVKPRLTCLCVMCNHSSCLYWQYNIHSPSSTSCNVCMFEEECGFCDLHMCIVSRQTWGWS